MGVVVSKKRMNEKSLLMRHWVPLRLMHARMFVMQKKKY